MSQLPQYYSILEIRTAYKRESLKTHPDKLSPKASAAERRRYTERFQAVADAYYVLSDPKRRAEYDALLRSRPSQFTTSSDPFEQDQASGNFFEEFSRFFQDAGFGGASAAGAAGAGTSGAPPGGFDFESESSEEELPKKKTGRPDANGIFGDVFEELLEPEVANVHHRWRWVGGAAGAALGYIIGNIPGAVAGVHFYGVREELEELTPGFAGNKLGAIRDNKGKPVAQVFATLPVSQKAEILRALAFKVLGSMA
ncbi:hypothetical protein A1Q1_01532 [Trichosporon asahii var. asahii CBS 2479]|uniref:J domain-containing protein n=1 Tax=Trichosporon asahii var. asahii (strain ATCC 90039 / CBS 2479 / JCM 2466 / KCTC 7840 / NBRC 103889/ NCYC 2677 / UAMH 7654) TaxID=1186058 RepID=J4UDS5_TRIAS|nr:hypothetical protein A1Q1_01532 [Trichosporon asahii var. asahii CBS 2479]EJT49330.1 hypothetical protein A1Q1_01532 [Trichosporon asahii var. asahii CBS 2479]